MRYFLKHALYPNLIESPPHPKLGLVVVIPCFNEPELLKTLEALKDCDVTQSAAEVIVVINHGTKAEQAIKARNQQTLDEAKAWQESNETHWKLHLLFMEDLPPKHAGVGLARKIGMDEAARRLVAVENENGVIVCFDADCTCEVNYLQAIETFFLEQAKCPAANISYKHRTEGLATRQKEAIEKYEFYLHYIIEQQRRAGYPYAFHTVGSSMAVRCRDYMSQGGMNRRKAGEDFYFIHKFTHHPHFGEIKNTTVYPSARSSDRVPFGTGKAVGDYLENKKDIDFYAPQTFSELKQLIETFAGLYGDEGMSSEQFAAQQTTMIAAFLADRKFADLLPDMIGNASSLETFKRRFFQWLNPFMLMKLMHFSRDGFYANVGYEEARKVLGDV